VLAVNKMDLVGYKQKIYDDIVADYRVFAAGIGIADFVPLPISGFKGDNIIANSLNTPWYRGKPRSIPSPTRPSRFECRCSGSTGRTWIFAAFPV
jgi:translation elongation factor EF-1alpha